MAYTLRKLIERYRNEPTSSFRKLSYEVRVKHGRLLDRIVREKGHWRIRNIHVRTVMDWHTDWSTGGKNAMASALVWRLRVVLRFGASVLKDVECKRLSQLLSFTRFPRSSAAAIDGITAEQATAIREKARQVGLFSMAFAQALNFDLGLGQKDIIGKWVPVDEPGEAVLSFRGKKWRRGLLWSNVNDDLTLRHTIGSGESVEFDLRRAPMVMEELQHIFKMHGERPSCGPLVLYECTGQPWSPAEFRRKRRKIAELAGVQTGSRNGIA